MAACRVAQASQLRWLDRMSCVSAMRDQAQQRVGDALAGRQHHAEALRRAATRGCRPRCGSRRRQRRWSRRTCARPRRLVRKQASIAQDQGGPNPGTLKATHRPAQAAMVDPGPVTRRADGSLLYGATRRTEGGPGRPIAPARAAARDERHSRGPATPRQVEAPIHHGSAAAIGVSRGTLPHVELQEARARRPVRSGHRRTAFPAGTSAPGC